MSCKIEKVRGFQLPWRKVMVFDCGCGETRLSYTTAPGAVRCPTGVHLLHFSGAITPNLEMK